jgi:hypothetical protein
MAYGRAMITPPPTAMNGTAIATTTGAVNTKGTRRPRQ